MSDPKLTLLLPFLLGPVIAIEAHAEIYLSENEAVASIFPGLKFTKKVYPLSSEDKDKIRSSSDESVRADSVRAYRAESGEWVIVDQALGKHEYITYAVGIQADGRVKNIEILEYRESYGKQVRDEPWRAQFVGKDKSAPLKLNKDIKNISGATLSSAHISGGVRRVLQTFEVLKNRT